MPLAVSLFCTNVKETVISAVACVRACEGEGERCPGRADERLGETLPHFLEGHSVREGWGSGWKWGVVITDCQDVGALPGLGETWKITCLPAPHPGSVCPTGPTSATGLHQLLPEAWGGPGL